MRKLTISLFSRAADAHAQRQTLTFEELIEDFRAPEICDNPATEGAATALKLEAPAWSSGCFRNDHRAKEDFISASLLVYDLDDVRNLDELRQGLADLRVCFAYHSTTRSGFHRSEGLHKLRLIFPLFSDLNAADYDVLWETVRNKLKINPDTTRRHPSGIYFAPVIFSEHKPSYIFECKLDGPYLGQTFSKKLEVRNEQYWLETIRLATNKHEALNKAAFALAKLGTQDVVDKCLDALQKNQVSAPVEDWGHARRTAQKAVEDAGEEDVLVKQNEAYISPGLSRIAETRLLKYQKAVASGSGLNNAAYEMGRFVPHAIDAETVTRALLAGWDKCKDKRQNKPEAEAIIATSLGSGSAAPLGIHDAWKEDLFFSQDGTGFAATESNTQVAVMQHPDLEGVAVYDVRHDACTYMKETPWGTGAGRIPDSDKPKLGPWVAKQLSITNVSSAVAFEALLARAQMIQHDVLLDYYRMLPHASTTDILDRVLIDSAGAADTEYTRLATRYWFTSVYARQVEPGCKADHALILSGPQGVGKSTFFSTIFPANIAQLCATEVIPEWNDKDCKITLSRYAVVELAELDQMSKNTVEGVKKFLTEASADVRPAFGRTAKHYPRRAVFGGSTNKDMDFLIDATGNRRFWPVHVGEFDMSWNERYRDLVWAQAKFVYESTHRWWPLASEAHLFRAVQQDVVAIEPFHDEMRAFLEHPASSKHWKTKGSPTGDEGMPVLEDGQVLGQVLPYVKTKQLATLLGLDHNKGNEVSRLKRELTILGWKETRRNGDRVWARKK